MHVWAASQAVPSAVQSMQRPPPMPQASSAVPGKQVIALHAHAPQSAAQLVQSSPRAGSQVPLPHDTQTPQSTVQVVQSSARSGSQVPSPQRGQRPQSAVQLAQVSPTATTSG